ncbi:MAG: hypothetical protein Rubg2KO_29390 [Rubricoccaceae bacterium]
MCTARSVRAQLPISQIVPRSVLLLLVFSLSGCLGEAPRENPLDPLSAGFRDEGLVEGRVTGIYPPFEGRPGVRLRLSPLAGGAELATTTGSSGTFLLDGVPEGRYAIRAEGDGYGPAADTIEVGIGQTTDVTLQLNALPVVTSQALRTVHIERWFPDVPLFRLEVEADVTDPDRDADIEGVALVVPDLGFRAELTETEPGRYTATLDAESLPGGQVQSLLGFSHRVEATDQTGAVGLGSPMSLVRVIEQTPLTARPQGLEAVGQNPLTLEWRPASLPFSFTYRVEVFLVDGAGIPNRVEAIEDLPPSATTYTVQQALSPGDYFWTVWVTDASGNRSRSKEAGFRIP